MNSSPSTSFSIATPIFTKESSSWEARESPAKSNYSSLSKQHALCLVSTFQLKVKYQRSHTLPLHHKSHSNMEK